MIYRFKNSPFPANFIYMILSRCTLNIGDSFYLIAFSYALVAVYNVSASQLATVTLLSRIPLMFSFVYGTYLNKIADKKKCLIYLQFIHIMLISLMLLFFTLKVNILYIYFFNTFFYMINNMFSAISSGVVPQSLNYDDDLIKKSVDVQYFSANLLDIISNFVGSLLLTFIAYRILMGSSIVIIFLGVYFLNRLLFKKEANILVQESVASRAYLSMAKSFFENKLASGIIVIEAILSGATDLLLTLTPLYLLEININLVNIGIVYSIRRAADLIGALIAPKINISPVKFFCLDYLFSGSLLLLLFIIDNLYIKLICYFLAFVIIGISGNVFEKLIYSAYPSTKLVEVYTIISSLFSFFGIVFLLIPYFYADIIVLGVGLNLCTAIIGIVLWLVVKMQNN